LAYRCGSPGRRWLRWVLIADAVDAVVDNDDDDDDMVRLPASVSYFRNSTHVPCLGSVPYSFTDCTTATSKTNKRMYVAHMDQFVAWRGTRTLLISLS
jgi:hypothetical protein